jgi:hypothetical protein
MGETARDRQEDSRGYCGSNSSWGIKRREGDIMPEFVVLAMEVKGLAVVQAATAEDAGALYEIPKEFDGLAMTVSVMTRAEFDAMQEVPCEDPNADCGCEVCGR